MNNISLIARICLQNVWSIEEKEINTKYEVVALLATSNDKITNRISIEV